MFVLHKTYDTFVVVKRVKGRGEGGGGGLTRTR